MFNRAPQRYAQTEAAVFRQRVEEELDDRMRQGDVILEAPDRSLWRLVVDNTGALSTEAVT